SFLPDVVLTLLAALFRDARGLAVDLAAELADVVEELKALLVEQVQAVLAALLRLGVGKRGLGPVGLFDPQYLLADLAGERLGRFEHRGEVDVVLTEAFDGR